MLLSHLNGPGGIEGKLRKDVVARVPRGYEVRDVGPPVSISKRVFQDGYRQALPINPIVGAEDCDCTHQFCSTKPRQLPSFLRPLPLPPYLIGFPLLAVLTASV